MSWRINDPSTLVSRWKLQGASGIITPDEMGRYPGTVANLTGWPASGPHNGLTCAELNGNNSVITLGDITQFNKVDAFTLCGWLNQDVIAAADYMFVKTVDIGNEIYITTAAGPIMRVKCANGGNGYAEFDYSTVVSAGIWVHVAMVFDGSQTGSANRLIVYVDSIPQVLNFIAAAIPATTADLSGRDATIGAAGGIAFDGRLQDWRLYSVPLTRDEINKIINTPAPSR